jgi:hypothetical protein
MVLPMFRQLNLVGSTLYFSTTVDFQDLPQEMVPFEISNSGNGDTLHRFIINKLLPTFPVCSCYGFTFYRAKGVDQLLISSILQKTTLSSKLDFYFMDQMESTIVPINDMCTWLFANNISTHNRNLSIQGNISNVLEIVERLKLVCFHFLSLKNFFNRNFSIVIA